LIMDSEKRLSRLESVIRNIQLRITDLEKENAGLIYRMDVSHSAVVENTLKHIQSQIEKLEKEITSLNYRIDENYSAILEIKKADNKSTSA
jgi:enoyl-[acyl-carrier-protein] reductase (NADH)